MHLHPGIIRIFSRALEPCPFEIVPEGERSCVLVVYGGPDAATARFNIAGDDILDRSRFSLLLLDIREDLLGKGFGIGASSGR